MRLSRTWPLRKCLRWLLVLAEVLRLQRRRNSWCTQSSRTRRNLGCVVLLPHPPFVKTFALFCIAWPKLTVLPCFFFLGGGGGILVFSFPLRGIPCFCWQFFPSFPGILGGWVEIEQSLFFDGFPCTFPKHGKEGQRNWLKLRKID